MTQTSFKWRYLRFILCIRGGAGLNCTDDGCRDEFRADAEGGFFMLQSRSSAIARTRRRSDEDARLFFIHIPKTGGTSIEEAGLEYGVHWGGKYDAVGLNVSSVNLSEGPQWLLEVAPHTVCSWQHVPPRYIDLEESPYRGSENFCVSRNPYERIISEYEFLLDKHEQCAKIKELSKDSDAGVPADMGSRVAHVAEKAVGNYLVDNFDFNLDQYISFCKDLRSFEPCTSEGLNYFIQRTLTDYLAGLVWQSDCHILPQSQYVWDADGHPWCTQVLRFENLSSSFDDLMIQRGFPVRLGEHISNRAQSCRGLGIANLTTQSRSLIEQVYSEDFERLGYARFRAEDTTIST